VILVDTSIWVNHFRKANDRLKELLLNGLVLTHPFVIGELACGNMKKRDEIISLLKALPVAEIATDDEVLYLIEKHGLMGIGIGLVDTHLLASTILTKTLLWTEDKRLLTAAKKLNILYQEPPPVFHTSN